MSSDNAAAPAASASVKPEVLAGLARQTVFFGHQSVGMNIMDGVQDLLKEQAVQDVRVTATTEPDQLTPGTVAHAAVGENGDPLGKIRAFAEQMDSGIGGKADVAAFKFCYIDVDAQTDVEQVFQAYRDALADLKQRYPDTRFVHVTMPLRTVQTGPKAVIKSVLGQPAGGYVENMLRNQYNDLLRKEYEGREPIFDLAAVESTLPDGSRHTYTYKGQQFFALNPAYTYDNGHLNERGRLLAASAFVDALSMAQSAGE